MKFVYKDQQRANNASCGTTLAEAIRANFSLVISGLISDTRYSVSDYAVFSRDFDADMQDEIPAANFAALKQDLNNKLGNYISRTVDQVTRADEFYEVVYQADFGQEEPVRITVTFHASDHSIVFLAFESEKVSWSTFQ